MTTFTNKAKNTTTFTSRIKGSARQGVYGIGVYGIAIYGVGISNYGVFINRDKNAMSVTNLIKN